MTRPALKNPNLPRDNKRGGARRTAAEREIDLVAISEMYLRGRRIGEIREFINKNRHYNLSLQTISSDIKLIHKRWLDSQIQDFNELKMKELKKLDELERAYWDEWERSRKNYDKTVTEKVNDESVSGPYSRVKVRKEVLSRTGGVEYLQGVERCIEQRCKILGLYDQAIFSQDWKKAAHDAGLSEVEAQQQFEAMVNMYVEGTKRRSDNDSETDKK